MAVLTPLLAAVEPELLESSTRLAVENGIERFVLVLTVSLAVATISRFSSWLRQVPYTLLLVIVGLGLAFLDVRLINLSPELILLIFLPPLLFEAAWNLEWKRLRKDWVPIALYAIGGGGDFCGGDGLWPQPGGGALPTHRPTDWS